MVLRTKKGNIEKVCFEEGKKLIKESLDIENLFVNSFIVGKNINIFPTSKCVPISEKNRKYFSSIEDKINALKTSSEIGVIK